MEKHYTTPWKINKHFRRHRTEAIKFFNVPSVDSFIQGLFMISTYGFWYLRFPISYYCCKMLQRVSNIYQLIEIFCLPWRSLIGRYFGFCFYWKARFVPSNKLSTSPSITICLMQSRITTNEESSLQLQHLLLSVLKKEKAKSVGPTNS